MLDPIKTQQQASDPNLSIWVMASAGSGKTKVLTDRILRLLLDDIEPHKILCLTYTKVASVEMQKRLFSELQKWAICDENELIDKLFNLCGKKPNQFLINKARGLLISNLDVEFKIKIQTIHSFCKGILQSFPFEAKIPVNFELIDENHAKILLKNCQKNVLNQAIEDESIRNIILKINSLASESTINELISQLLNNKDKIFQIRNVNRNIDDLAVKIYKRFKIDASNNGKSDQLIENIFTNFLSEINLNKLQNFSDKIAHGTQKDNKSADLINQFIENPQLGTFESLVLAFFTKEYTPRKFSKKITEIFENEINIFYQKIDDFNQLLQASVAIENSINLLKIVDRVLDEFQRIKIENGFLDYSDLINIANQVLVDPKNCEWIKLKMDCSFDHLLVDEAQDTNPMQWSIIKALIDDFFSGESKSQNPRSIFIVGDEKQSIMGFQGAEINKTKDFYDYLTQKSNHELKNIDLNVSFRSGQNILRLVDCVFENPLFQNAICKIGAYKNHHSYRSSVGYVEVWQYDEKIFEQNSSSIEDENSVINDLFKANINSSQSNDFIAKIVANKIKEWVDSKRLVTDKNRAVEYGDIMILLRKRQNGLMEKLANNFAQLGIPFASVGKIKFSENLLIQDFLSLARFALLKSDEFNLACLLKSPFFNYNEQQLLEVCITKNTQNLSLWEILKNTKDGENLNQIIDLAKNNNSFDFFFTILKNSANQNNIIARFGEEGFEIINNFLLICQDFCNKNSPNLQSFLEFVEKIDPEISITNNHSNRIKITTIHSSKGLQAPIVIMPDCLYSYSKQIDNREKIIWDEDFPLWIVKNAKINNQIKKIFDEKIAQNYEEHLRLLYVALTRAEDEIYIAGISKEFDEKCWYKIINSLNENFINKVTLNYENLLSTQNNQNINDYEFEKSHYKNIQKNSDFNQINSALIFGDYLHKALEFVGKNYIMPNDWIINFVEKYFQNYYQLSKQNCDEINSIIKNYLNSNIYRDIFDKNLKNQIKCEYEVLFNQQKLRIDLLKITPTEILILDYKSDEKIPDQTPKNYHQQLQLYREALSQQFPNHQIQCAILWIRFLKLDFIE